MHARRGAWWDANKIGLGPPPLETPEGWLILYHGVRVTAGGCLYRLGLALLDLEDPCRVLRRSDEWVFGPETPYERQGDVNGVVFPCGWILDKPGGIFASITAAPTPAWPWPPPNFPTCWVTFARALASVAESIKAASCRFTPG